MCIHIYPLEPVDICQCLRMKAQEFRFIVFSVWQPDYCSIFNFHDFSWLQSLCWIDPLFQNHCFFDSPLCIRVFISSLFHLVSHKWIDGQIDKPDIL